MWNEVFVTGVGLVAIALLLGFPDFVISSAVWVGIALGVFVFWGLIMEAAEAFGKVLVGAFQ